MNYKYRRLYIYIYIKLMRIHHWIKNLLVFAPILFAGELFNVAKIIDCGFGFFAFCLVSSAVYVVNDICDRKKDRNHPTKCNRPIASGEIPVKCALIFLFILTFIGLLFNNLVFSFVSTIILISYFLLNVLYSSGLKNVPILDVSILTIGFLLRILYGGFITNIKISNWLYLTVVVIALYFSLGKRRNELKMINGDATRTVLKKYPISFLENSMNMCLTLTNVFYSLWCMSAETITHYNSNYLVLTAPIVLLITLKYSLNVEGDSDGDPVEVLLSDKVLIAMVLLYISVMFYLLYI